MLRARAIEYANQRLTDLGLTDLGWSFTMSDSLGKGILGQCRFGVNKQILLAGWYADLNNEELVFDTINHELAHAIVGYREDEDDGHGPKWIEACSITGAKPQRSKQADRINETVTAYFAVCHKCASRFMKKRITKGAKYFCQCTRGHKPRIELCFSKSTRLSPAVVKAGVDGELELIRSNQRMTSNMVVPAKIESLLSELRVADPKRAKSIRAQLRKLGHRGGMNA